MPYDKMKSTVKALLPGGKKKDDQDSLWPVIKDKFDMGAELRQPYERRWIINLSFLAGRQYVFFNEAAQLLQSLIQRKGRIRIVDNKLLPRYRKQISRLIRNQPQMSVVPESNEREDIDAASVGDKVLKHFWRQDKMRGKIMELGGWIYSCGNGFLDDRWDPKKGPTEFDVGKGELKYLGDVTCGVWSPFEIGVPAAGLGDTDHHELPWLVKARFRPLEWIKFTYKRGKEVSAEDRELNYIDSAGIWGLNSGPSAQKAEGARVIELYVKPCGDYPKGLFVTGANGIVLQKSDYPFDYFHIEHFKDNVVPGIYWGMATLEAAIWLQKLWNRTLSDIAEFNRSMARGKWLVPRAAQMSADPDDSHGQILNYNPVLGHKPEMMTLKGLPPTYMQLLDVIAQSLMEVFHQHEVTMGTNRSDIRSGDMVGMLMESDDWGNIPTHAVFEESLERALTRVLRRIQKGYTEERILKIRGRDGRFEIIAFKGADLRNNTDVSVRKESTLPQSRIGRQKAVLERFQVGLYGNPADPKVRERVNIMLDEVPETLEDMYEEAYLDRQIAMTENETMFSHPGISYMINQYDDHAIHLEQHRLFRKTSRYQDLKMDNYEQFVSLEATFQEHELQHRKFLAEAQAAQLKQMMMLEEAKGGKGGGEGRGQRK